MDYEKKYKELIEKIELISHSALTVEQHQIIDTILGELKESEDEQIRKRLVEFFKDWGKTRSHCWSIYIPDILAWLEKQGESYTKRDVDDAWLKGMCDAKRELEKQGNSPIKWNKNTKDCKPKVSHSVLMKTTHGIAEGEWQGEHWHQYRWAGLVRDTDVLSWMELSDLEKQGEQRPFDYENANIQQKDFAPKAEPKFKVGDWVVSPNGVYWHVDAIRDGRYQVSSNLGECTDWSLDTNIYHKFTIQDAKDGDVLFALGSKQPFIYKERNPHEQAIAYCGINKYGKFFVWMDENCIITLDKYVPATLEQRDLLFQKMKESGYEWDAEKKKLKLLITNGGDFFESENCGQKHADTVEQKCEESKTKVFDAPTSFEDKLYAFVLACEILVDPSKREFILEHSQEILDAAREQIGKEQSSTWTKEDEKMVDNILTPLATRYPFDIYQPMYSWLKALKQRIGG